MVYYVTATITSWVEHCWYKKLLLMHTWTFYCGFVNMWTGVVSKSLIQNGLKPGTDQNRFCSGIPKCLCCIQQKEKGVSKWLQLKSSSVVSKSLMQNGLRPGADHGYTKWLCIYWMFCYVFWPGSIAVNLQRSVYVFAMKQFICDETLERLDYNLVIKKYFYVWTDFVAMGFLPILLLYIVKCNAAKM